MSAGIVFGREQITTALRKLGCEPASGVVFKGEKTKPHSFWRTPWDHVFMVPDEECGHWVIQDIIDQEVEGTRPSKGAVSV